MDVYVVTSCMDNSDAYVPNDSSNEYSIIYISSTCPDPSEFMPRYSFISNTCWKLPMETMFNLSISDLYFDKKYIVWHK